MLPEHILALQDYIPVLPEYILPVLLEYISVLPEYIPEALEYILDPMEQMGGVM